MMKKFFLHLLPLLLALALPLGMHAEPPQSDEYPDLLTYPNGDCLQGRVLAQSNGLVVFRSLRFGELRLPANEIKLTRIHLPAAPGSPPPPPATAAIKPSPAPSPATPTAAPTASKPAAKPLAWDELLPVLIAEKLHAFFGPWHGRFSFAIEAAADTNDRKNLSADFHLQRKWKADEVQLRQHFEDNSINDVTTSNRLKAEGSWRHDFPRHWFAQYRPALEWNRASIVADVFSSYVLMQHDLGVGRTLLSTDKRKIRIGVAENFFDNWNTALKNVHTSRGVDSGFVEAELKMPWQMTLTQRAVYYYSITSRETGWESQLEVSKKLTETISTAIRHELRRAVPDGRSPDFTYLRVLLGLDF